VAGHVFGAVTAKARAFAFQAGLNHIKALIVLGAATYLSYLFIGGGYTRPRPRS